MLVTKYHSKLVGVTFEGRQDVIKDMVGGEKLRFRREPDNEYDSNAVAVDALVWIGDVPNTDQAEEWNPIGYIAKDKNVELAKVLDEDKHAKITLSEVTGGDDKAYGVNVEIEYEKLPELKPSSNRKLLEAFVGGEIYYDDDKHEYTNKEGEVYLSGSVYAKSFQKPFDAKMMAGIMAKKVEKASADDIVAMWELKSEASRDFGNAVHKALQLYEQYGELAESLNKTTHSHDHPALKKAVDGFIEAHKGENVLCEVLVVDHEAKHAGRIDRLRIIDTNNKICRVQDYKTNVKADKEYWTHQLKFYARILEKAGWTVEGRDIFQYTDTWKEIQV